MVVAATFLAPASCRSDNTNEAEDVAAQFMNIYRSQPKLVVTGTGTHARASLRLSPTDGANGCPWARVTLAIPDGFFAGAPGTRQLGCTDQQTPPIRYGRTAHGVSCSVEVLPDERQYVLEVFCG